ncbi:MAG: hypothetical protein JNL51_18045 [Chitinophagaceae bacterium]|nr:hypothetical protein [Chitinophagaceae bacterium]
MKKSNLFLIVGLLASIYSCNSKKENKGESVIFPKISEAIQITDSSHEHLFASYFGINSFDKSERYATVLETDLKFKLPDNVNEPATLGLVDLETHEFIPLTKTRAWNFQQGCMAHWLGTSPDSLIIYNDYRDGRFVSIIMNVHTKKEIKMFPYPIGAVSEDGKEAVSLNFSRIRLTRPDYGYGGDGQDSHKDIAFPKDDGIFLINLETGETKLLLSYYQVKDLVPPVGDSGLLWFNHTKFSKGGTKLFFFGRQKNNLNDKGRYTTSFTINTDGTNLQRCFPADADWGGSHFDWLNDDELLVTANYQGKQYSHVLFTPGQKNYERLGGGLLDYDGHATFSPDKKWMVTDTYPSILREQKIYLLNMETQAILPLGRFSEPQEYSREGFWRCDIHCRWSSKGDIIGFNSTHSGSRQVYIFKLTI